MKNFAKILLPIISFASTSLASEITIQPKGRFDFSSGFITNQREQSHNNTQSYDKEKERSNRKGSVNRNGFGFFSQGRFILNVKNQLENNISYGAQIALQTNSRSDRSTPSHLFFESDAGKWELGSDKSIMSKMKITGYSHASATAGIWDAWLAPDIRDRKIQYVTNAGNFLDPKCRNSNKVEYSRKISYYSPKIFDFQLGVSYVPDTVNDGGGPIKDDAPDYHMVNRLVKGYAFDIKDGIALGLTKEHKLSDKTSVKVSLVTEFGKVAVKKPTEKEFADAVKAGNELIDPKNVKFKKLSTYNIGAELKHGKFAVAGCYADFRKSLTASDPLIDPADRKKSYLYNVGAKYSFEKVSVSAHYFHSENKKNVVGATTVGVDYKLAPGIMPYAEFTAFHAKGAYKAKNKDTTYISDNHHGTLFLVGMKLEF